MLVCVIQPAIPSVPPRFLTSGSWDVTSLCALDDMAGKMYVRATLCEAGAKSPLCALNGPQLLSLEVQETGDGEVVIITTSMTYCGLGALNL